MLDIKNTVNGTELTVKLIGRLDTTTAPVLEGDLRKSVDNIEKLIFEISELEYISSAGLRVLLSAQKVMNKQGEMIIRGANETVMEVFEVTGFVDILNIEDK
ncbi:STAS domain-containing protein [Huintestinicola sp.]|uniref:STAS domain-containing protein n=1 Tax=Huintestinicola sp. TaxID=2981661 RepID=UPI003D7D0D6F